MWVLFAAAGSGCQLEKSKLLSYQQLWLFGDFPGNPLAKTRVDCKPVLPLESCLVTRDGQRSHISSPAEVFIRITFIDSRKFSLHQISTALSKCLPIPAVFPSILSLHPISLPTYFPPHQNPHSSLPIKYILRTLPGISLFLPQTPLLYLTSLGLQIVACQIAI